MRNRQKKWHPYKSGLEAAFARSMKDKGIEFRYEPETLTYRRRVVKGICGACEGDEVYQRRTYLPDFRIDLSEGRARESGPRYIYIETKGRLTSADRGKMVAVKQEHPGLDIRFVFGANNKLQKNKNERYSDWATKHGFPYSVGAEFPTAWLQPAPGLSIDPKSGPVRRRGGGRKAPE